MVEILKIMKLFHLECFSKYSLIFSLFFHISQDHMFEIVIIQNWKVILIIAITISIFSNDVIMGAIASKFTSLTIVYSTVYLDAGQRKHQSSASLALMREILRGPVNSPHKWPVTRKMFPFDEVIMINNSVYCCYHYLIIHILNLNECGPRYATIRASWV